MSADDEVIRLKALLQERDKEIAQIKSSIVSMGPTCGVS